MLILTRKLGESITIGERVQIKVLSIKGGQVRLGVEAPREVKINREEIQINMLSEGLSEGDEAHSSPPESGSNEAPESKPT